MARKKLTVREGLLADKKYYSDQPGGKAVVRVINKALKGSMAAYQRLNIINQTWENDTGW